MKRLIFAIAFAGVVLSAHPAQAGEIFKWEFVVDDFQTKNEIISKRVVHVLNSNKKNITLKSYWICSVEKEQISKLSKSYIMFFRRTITCFPPTEKIYFAIIRTICSTLTANGRKQLRNSGNFLPVPSTKPYNSETLRLFGHNLKMATLTLRCSLKRNIFGG